MKRHWPGIMLLLLAFACGRGGALGASQKERAGLPVVSLRNAGFERDWRDGWELAREATGDVAWDTAVAHAGRGSLRLAHTGGKTALLSAARELIAVRPGETLKLSAFVRLQDATGETYLSLQGYRAGQFVKILGQTQPTFGDTAGGWQYRVLVADVPGNGEITHLRIGLHSDNNSGQAWLDDVRLQRVPPNRPVVTGPPPPPPYGKLRVSGGHFVGAEGRRVRLWGVNVYEETLRSYREQRHIARRIRQMGFNAVRIWWHDRAIVDTEARTARGETTSLIFRQSAPGDGSELDRMDYFVYCAEREGLYLYMSLDRMTQGVFGPGDYDVLPSAGPEDEKAWKAAVAELQPPGSTTNEHVVYVDPRLGEAHARYVAHVISRRNPYTGRVYAEDPYVVLWEETNENPTPQLLLTGGFRQWPRYFQDVLKRRWNEWLRAKYHNDAGVRRAWGELLAGESLQAGSIACAPVLSERANYPAARGEDFCAFVYDLILSYSQRLRQIIHAAGPLAAQTPVGFNTLFEHKHKMYYPASQGDVVIVGIYLQGPATLDPQKRRLRPDFYEFYNFSYATVRGKPMIVYETNTIKPDAWRADYPLLVAAHAATHDWDGVFWYTWSDGTVLHQFDDDTYQYTGLRYASVGHYWHGIVICTDEALLASLKLAGALFRGFALPPHADPVIITVGRRDLLSPHMWIGDIDIPYPPDAPPPYPRSYALALTDMLYGCQYVYDMTQERSFASRPLIGQLPHPYSPVPGLTYDGGRGRLKIDTPQAKAIVGFIGRGERFRPYLRLQLTSPHEPDFVCFGVVATDGRPLDTARRALLILTTYGENPGRTLWDNPDAVPGDVPRFAKLVRSWGWGPVPLARPGARLTLGQPWRWRLYDFLGNVLREGQGDVLDIPPGLPVFYGEMWR